MLQRASQKRASFCRLNSAPLAEFLRRQLRRLRPLPSPQAVQVAFARKRPPPAWAVFEQRPVRPAALAACRCISAALHAHQRIPTAVHAFHHAELMCRQCGVVPSIGDRAPDRLGYNRQGASRASSCLGCLLPLLPLLLVYCYLRIWGKDARRLLQCCPCCYLRCLPPCR